ncbi:MAG: carboxypeptidase-like regulatory domain-containing protein, partial [Acidobacteria bacterium]|nr:carboxypeptidase-like regulatory domain-containing protein [Acidobacteriota bacterium]
GRYSFLVPEGNYYLKVEAWGYTTYYSNEFEVKNGIGVLFNLSIEVRGIRTYNNLFPEGSCVEDKWCFIIWV